MHFAIEFRDAPSDSPITTVNAPYPIPVPAQGDFIELHERDQHIPLARVDRVQWSYTMTPLDEAPAATLSVRVFVWLSPI